jgi:hypothetical protein
VEEDECAKLSQKHCGNGGEVQLIKGTEERAHTHNDSAASI